MPIPANAISVKSVAATTLLKIEKEIYSYPPFQIIRLQNREKTDT
jgi:hypothetical protein